MKNDNHIPQSADTDMDEAIIEEEDSFHAKDLAVALNKLKDELAHCKSERDGYLAGWQRSKADFVNARSQEERSRQVIMTFATQKLLVEIIRVAHIFDRAFEGQDMTSPYVQGFGHIRGELYKLLETHGATAIKSLGQPFDASCQEAVENVLTDDLAQDGLVVEEVEKGFTIDGKVIQPSKVKVATYKK